MRSVGRATHDIRQEPRGGDVMVANIGFTIISPLTRLRICYWPFPHAAHGVSDNPRGSAAPSHNKHFYALHIRRGARTPVRGPDRGLCRETSGQAPRLLGRCPASAGRWLCRGGLCVHSIRGALVMSQTALRPSLSRGAGYVAESIKPISVVGAPLRRVLIEGERRAKHGAFLTNYYSVLRKLT